MKRSIIILLGICQAYVVLAQVSTSSTDTIPSPSVNSGDEPQIIYYQSTEPDGQSKKKDRYQIKTLSGKMSHSGGFGALSFRTSEFRDESLVFAGLRGGWIINRTLAIGLEGHGIIPTAKFDFQLEDVNDNIEASLNGGYGGLFLELIFFSNEVVHATVPVSGGAGWLGYLRSDDDNFFPGVNSEVDGDVFWYVEPGANLEFNISRNFRLDFGVSKRFTQDLELIDTESKDFENLNYYITLKIGSF